MRSETFASILNAHLDQYKDLMHHTTWRATQRHFRLLLRFGPADQIPAEVPTSVWLKLQRDIEWFLNPKAYNKLLNMLEHLTDSLGVNIAEKMMPYGRVTESLIDFWIAKESAKDNEYLP